MPIVLKYGSLNRLEPSGPVQACNGDCFTLTLRKYTEDCNIATLQHCNIVTLQHCASVKKLLINTIKYSWINNGILTCDSLLSWYNVVARTKSQPAALSWHVCSDCHSCLSWELDNISVRNFYCRIHKPQLICRRFSNSFANAHVQKFLIHKFSYLDILWDQWAVTDSDKSLLINPGLAERSRWSRMDADDSIDFRIQPFKDESLSFSFNL